MVNSGFGSNSVSVIDTHSNIVVATVSVGNIPAGVAITPNGAFAYVANYSSNTLSVIDTASNTVVATVPIGDGNNPLQVAITPDGTSVYVTNESSNTVSVVSTASNTVVATVPVGISPFGVASLPPLQPRGVQLSSSESPQEFLTVIATRYFS